MLRFLISLSGAQADILEREPTEKARYAALGGAILVTGVLSSACLAWGLYEAANVALVPAVAIGLILAFFFLNLDRWLLTPPTVGARRMLLTTLPRIMLGLLLGFLLSSVLILQLFREDINVKIPVIRQQEAAEFQQITTNSYLSKQIELLRDEIVNYQRIISTEGQVRLNPSQERKY